MKTTLEFAIFLITADSKSRRPHRRKAHFFVARPAPQLTAFLYYRSQLYPSLILEKPYDNPSLSDPEPPRKKTEANGWEKWGLGRQTSFFFWFGFHYRVWWGGWRRTCCSPGWRKTAACTSHRWLRPRPLRAWAAEPSGQTRGTARQPSGALWRPQTPDTINPKQSMVRNTEMCIWFYSGRHWRLGRQYLSGHYFEGSLRSLDPFTPKSKKYVLPTFLKRNV